VLADEVHTPDSSRYWLSPAIRALRRGQPPETLDKDFVRRWCPSAAIPTRIRSRRSARDRCWHAAQICRPHEQLNGRSLLCPTCPSRRFTRIAELEEYFGKAA